MNNKLTSYVLFIAGIIMALVYVFVLFKSSELRFFTACFVISLVVLVGVNLIVRKIIENYRD